MTKLKDGEMIMLAAELPNGSKHSRNWGRCKILLKSSMFLLCWDRNIFGGEGHFCVIKELCG